MPDFRISSADELLKRKIIYGCIEVGTVFRALCISRRIPAIFVETLRKKWLESKPDPKNPRMIEGHIFIDVFVNKKWHTVDPGSPSWLHRYEDYSIKVNELGKYEVIGKGLDSIDLGFSDMMTFRKLIAKKYNMPHLIDDKAPPL